MRTTQLPTSEWEHGGSVIFRQLIIAQIYTELADRVSLNQPLLELTSNRTYQIYLQWLYWSSWRLFFLILKINKRRYGLICDYLIFFRIHHQVSKIVPWKKYLFLLSAYSPGGNIPHNLGVTPDLVIVQLKMWDGFVYEADGIY